MSIYMPEKQNGHGIESQDLVRQLTEARQCTLRLFSDLTDEQMLGPMLRIVNPPLWEIGHVAWFHEKWTLRHLRGQEPIRDGVDSLYDSAAVAHDSRWRLSLPSRRATLNYMDDVLGSIVGLLGTGDICGEELYFHLLPIYHEYMHSEALTYTRQTLSYAQPVATHPTGPNLARNGRLLTDDVEVPGGNFILGADKEEPFVFDNEKWAHSVKVEPFKIARTAVTNSQFAEFVEVGGYKDDRYWSLEGLAWRKETDSRHPVYWKPREGGGWLRRHFDKWTVLEEGSPVIHVNWYEAEAYCNWARRRLPTEAEWEMAAGYSPSERRKLRFPWGDDPPNPERANLDWQAMGCIDAAALESGDSPFGCRQMIGNVWEWTVDDFGPYPGFVVDPYKEYSVPWFGGHKVLRGGCWTTRAKLIRNTWRNFYTPDRRDVLAGFRTCAR
ncbi:MAG TPA: selenoneine synthase SenA [Blastocatellia bacterium]|nr:selenoneine synthase SenA [Blastocatellia bacterium]